MFLLVTDIDAYPQFLPWCSETRIVSKDEKQTTAELKIAFKGVKQSFVTKNHNHPCEKVIMELVDGPFDHLAGEWQFQPLSDSASKIILKLEFSFSSRWLEKIVGPVFGMIGNTMVESFQQRAKQLYS